MRRWTRRATRQRRRCRFTSRNAPTPLMKELGYNRGYQYAHNSPEAYIPQEYLPDQLRDAMFYVPARFGLRDKDRRADGTVGQLKQREQGVRMDL